MKTKREEKLASDYIRAAVDVGMSYDGATRDQANELDREVDILVARLSKAIAKLHGAGTTSKRGDER